MLLAGDSIASASCLPSGSPASGMAVISSEQGGFRAGPVLVFPLKISDLAQRSKFSNLYFSICRDKRHTAMASQVLSLPIFRSWSFQHKHKMYDESIVHT